jgi:hypothetical protein
VDLCSGLQPATTCSRKLTRCTCRLRSTTRKCGWLTQANTLETLTDEYGNLSTSAYMKADDQIRRELLLMIERRMDAAHRLYARLAQLRTAVSDPTPVEGVHNQTANGAMILRHVLEGHLDNCERDWSVLDEQVCPATDRQRRPVG